MSALLHERIELPIEGMTCASCASRIERKLNTLDGVTATVNYATEKATVEYDAAEVTTAALLDAVEQVGYSARLPDGGCRRGAGGSDGEPAPRGSCSRLRCRCRCCWWR